MKKIQLLVIVVGILFLVSSVTAITTTKEIVKDDCGCEKKLNLYTSKQVQCDNVVLIDGKYPALKEFPPKSEEALALIDPDPVPLYSSDQLPSQFSWLSYGGDWTTPAKDQGNCGSCWAFGALGGLEASINIKRGYPDFDRDLSEQYILSCLSAAGSCSGGWMSEAIAYIQSTNMGSTGNGINGCPLESCMPYQAKDYIPCDNKCNDWDTYHNPPEEDDILWQIDSYGVTTGSEDDPNHWNLMKSWVLEHGPIVVDIYTGGWSSYWSSHHSPTDVYEQDDYGITNHAQVLCGWVDDPDILNGGYWIIKNSWGPGWGYGGFSNIAYGCNSLGTRDVTWVEAMEWPEQQQGPGPIDVDMSVFSDFDYESKYPHLGEEIEFTDTSDGDVTLWEWDFDGDGVIDSNNKNPDWTYYQEGDYEVYLKVWSQWGLNSNRTKIVSVKENWPPEIKELPLEFVGHGLSYHFDARYCTDPDGSISEYFWDFGDGTTSDESYLDHTYDQGDRIYEVTLTITDNDGGSSTGICNLKIDQTVPPVTNILHGIGSFGSDWYKETQRISFSATDWTKVIDTFYRVDGGSWERYIASEQQFIPIGSEGEHTVEAYSVDYYGNEETPVSDTFLIDKTDPSIDVSFSGVEEDGYYINEVTVTLTGDDALSGIGNLFYKYKTLIYVEYDGPFVIDDRQGIVHLDVMAVDNAGNEFEKTETVQINNIYPPSKPTITGETSGTPGEELTYTFVSNDPGNEIYYYIEWEEGDSEGWLGPYDSSEEVEKSHVYTTQGSKYIKVKAKNQYDVESDWGTLTVTMPRSVSRFTFFERLLSQFPILEKILPILVKLII